MVAIAWGAWASDLVGSFTFLIFTPERGLASTGDELVARMSERRERNPGPVRCGWADPDFASLHPGYSLCRRARHSHFPSPLVGEGGSRGANVSVRRVR